jgi:hypothetical protein
LQAANKGYAGGIKMTNDATRMDKEEEKNKICHKFIDNVAKAMEIFYNDLHIIIDDEHERIITRDTLLIAASAAIFNSLIYPHKNLVNVNYLYEKLLGELKCIMDKKNEPDSPTT